MDCLLDLLGQIFQFFQNLHLIDTVKMKISQANSFSFDAISAEIHTHWFYHHHKDSMTLYHRATMLHSWKKLIKRPECRYLTYCSSHYVPEDFSAVNCLRFCRLYKMSLPYQYIQKVNVYQCFTTFLFILYLHQWQTISASWLSFELLLRFSLILLLMVFSLSY